MWHVHFKHKLPKMQNFKLVIWKFATNNRIPMYSARCIQCAQCRQLQNATIVLALTWLSVQHCTTTHCTLLPASLLLIDRFDRPNNPIFNQKLPDYYSPKEIILGVVQLKFNFNNVDYFVWQTKSLSHTLNGTCESFLGNEESIMWHMCWVCILPHLNKWNDLIRKLE